jgi:predicted metalloprotease with PDZ domain
VEVALDLLGAQNFTPNLATLRWSSALVYPQGTDQASYPVHASVLLPPGWGWGAALELAAEEKGRVAFAPVSLETLVDSPLLTGRHLRRIPIGPPSGPPHSVVVAAETEEGLEMPAVWKERFDRLIAEAHALFGGRHYRRYDFLLALSDHIDHFALEHHQSSDNHFPEKFLRSPRAAMGLAWIPAHEYVHSWNGKYRRPRGLVTRDMQEPLRTSGLWIYEGLTHYLGFVLAARSGAYTSEEFRDAIATQAAIVVQTKGRDWRALEDTATASAVLEGARPAWAASRRTWGDYYREGLLLWLEVDVSIREKTGGARSLDDFCRAFFGGEGPPEVQSYEIADVIAALDSVAASDWKRFFAERVAAVAPQAPLGGLERSGWRLSYGAKPGPYFSALEADYKELNLLGSLGFALGADKWDVIDVVPGSPADRAGLAPGGRVVAVNGRRQDREVLADAIEATPGRGSVELLVEDADFFRSYVVEYRGGPRYPLLERDPSRPDLLASIAAPHAAGK